MVRLMAVIMSESMTTWPQHLLLKLIEITLLKIDRLINKKRALDMLFLKSFEPSQITLYNVDIYKVSF